MIDFFGIRRRRREKEERRLEEVRLAKEQYQERKKLIDKFLDEYHKKDYDERSKRFQESSARIKEENNACSKCGSKNVIQNIARIKGELHGEGHSYHSSTSTSGLFSSYNLHYSGSYSKVDGELDTHPINKCKDCGHEWHIKEAKMESSSDIFSQYGGHAGFLFRRVREYVDLKYDPYNIKEECNSLEEMQQKFTQRYKNYWLFKEYRDLPRYMLDLVMYEGMSQSHSRLKNVDPKFGYEEGMDKYSYQIPPELWKVVKALISWNGKE